jgi:Mg/Co/Ni transporter MgtE
MNILTQEHQKKLASAAQETYQQIGQDLANIRQEMGEKNCASQAEIIECVLDADRIITIGKLDKDVYELFKTFSYKTQIKLMKKIFKYKWYE